MENTEMVQKLAEFLGKIVDEKVAEAKNNGNGKTPAENVVDDILNPETSTTIEDVMDTIKERLEDDLGDYLNDNGWFHKDDIDEDWLFDNVDDYILKDVTRRYIDENL